MKRLLSLAILVVLPMVAMGKEDLSKYSGTYKSETRSISYLTMTLSLGDDGTATLTQSPDAVNEITSFGRWIRQGDIIRLNFESVGKQPAPAPCPSAWSTKPSPPSCGITISGAPTRPRP